MTIYWVDPYLGATSQCNGTTDTTTKSGTYAAPWAWTDLCSTSSANMTAINGTTLAYNDEIRIKGLPFATLFTLGNSTAHCRYTSLYPNNGFSNLADFQATSIVALDPTQMQAFTGPCETDYIFCNYKFSNSTATQSDYGHRGLHELLGSQYGITNQTLKLHYFESNYYDNTSYTPFSANTYFLPYKNSIMKFTVSAGWTSSTVQAGITVIPMIWSSAYRSLYFGNAGGTTDQYDFKVDCEHLHLVSQSTTKAAVQDYKHMLTSRSPETPLRTQKLGGFYGSYTNYIYNSSLSASNQQIDKVIGYDVIIQNYTQNNASEQTINFMAMGYITNEKIITRSNASSYAVNINLGTIAVDTYQNYDKIATIFWKNSDYGNIASVNIKDNSVLCVSGSTYTNYVQWQLLQTGTGEVRALNFGSNVTNTTPHHVVGMYGKALDLVNTSIASANLPYLTANWHDSNPLYNSTFFAPFATPEVSYGVLEMGSSDYRTSDNTINLIGANPNNINFDPLNSSDSSKRIVAPLIMFETNDYDGVPIALLPCHSTSSNSICGLLYNDSSNSDILTFQPPTWDGTSTKSFAIPFKVSIPDYTQGSSTVTLSIDLSVNTALNNAQSSYRLFGLYRNSAGTNGVGLDSSSLSNNTTLSTSDSSPTTVSMALSLPSSGQPTINSAVLVLEILVADDNKGHANKLKIHDVSVSVS